MELLILSGLLLTGSAAGVLGALFGLGGGFIFVPVLMLVFGLAPAEAVAVSLVGIIAGSTGASTVFVDRGSANVRLGLLMEITTAAGAVIGAALAAYLEDWLLMCIFSAVVLYSAARMILDPEKVIAPAENASGRFVFSYKDDGGRDSAYEVQNVRGGMLLCTAAGMISSMTGVGGGAVKVPLMNLYMHIPIKVASPTSSYMIGITAFSGAITYLLSGQILLEYAAGIAAGAFAGSLAGSAIASRVRTKHLRKYFSALLIAVAVLVLLQAGGIL